MHRELVVLFAGLVIGFGITFGILVPLFRGFWRRHDRQVAARNREIAAHIDSATARMEQW